MSASNRNRQLRRRNEEPRLLPSTADCGWYRETCLTLYIYTGKPQRVDGAKDNAPPNPFRLSPTRRTRETSRRMLREVEVGKREPNETPDAFRKSRMGHSSLNAGKPRTPG